MKKSIKKKTDKYAQFKNRTNSVNYRDEKAIIEQFNKSVREYKRFSEVFHGGDEELASSKLRDAGTDLYMCCEWALKNYLYKKYGEQLAAHDISSQTREYKVNQLSTKTANIQYLLTELENIGVPSVDAAGVDSQKIIKNAQVVNNGPKHDRTIPDPDLYKSTLEEVRKIIRCYVNEKAELELIDDCLYGDGNAWYEILEDTSEFNSAYSYVLITKRIESIAVNGLFSLKWDLVIDMDPDSDISGLAHNYTDVTGIIPRVRTLDFANSRKKFSFSHMPYWIMANGTSDIPDSVVDPKKWGTAHGKYLSSLLEEFHKEYSKPVKAFVYPMENERNLRKIVDTFNDVYDSVAGHVSEINLCIQIADLAKNLIDEEDFNKYLTSDNGKWAVQYIDKAETLWNECKQLASDSAYEDLDGIEERLRSLTASIEESIDIWNEYITNAGNKNCTQAKRILARSYLKAADQTENSKIKQDFYTKAIQLMEDNIAEENQYVDNIRIWFDSIKRIEVENQDQLIQDAVIKLNRWVNLTDSVDAHYYRFILKFIQAVDGSTLAEGELPKLLRELKQKAANKYNRTVTQHWFSKSRKGLNALIVNNRNRKNAIPEDEMVETLFSFIGRISNNYVNDSHAYINWHGVEVYFNPSATNGEIGKANIGQRVRFGLGFSYDGPRAYNNSIKLLGKDEFVENKREIESGIAVKCEVIKNVGYYVQVRIIGFSEIGSVHVNELMEPYSANARPDIGAVFDGKVLTKRFDNAKHRDIWQITMNMNNAKEDEEAEETAMAKALKRSGIKLQG